MLISMDFQNEIQQKVEFMGGIYTKELRGSVTHLVTDSVISAKYDVIFTFVPKYSYLKR